MLLRQDNWTLTEVDAWWSPIAVCLSEEEAKKDVKDCSSCFARLLAVQRSLWSSLSTFKMTLWEKPVVCGSWFSRYLGFCSFSSLFVSWLYVYHVLVAWCL